ncbi:hypothetical protein M432DRAFT_552736 [Thermoascus aurantiacus ATCC 26904]
MSSAREDSVPHEVRTAAEPRQNRLYTVRLSQIVQVNPMIRLLRLTLPPPATEQTQTQESNEQQQQPFTFLPGQWLDVHIPGIPQAGGFTITSTPKDAELLPSPETPESLPAREDGLPPIRPRGREPYVELAVQKSPSNPPAAWLWRPKEEILGKELSIRVGGSFVWPPTGIGLEEIRNVVFVAGGVGINPLISMLSHISETPTSLPSSSPTQIHFLYSTRVPPPSESPTSSTATAEDTLNQILFLPRLREIARSHTHAPSQRLLLSVDLFLTNLREHPDLVAALSGEDKDKAKGQDFTIHDRRIEIEDLRAAVGVGVGDGTVCFVCGPPAMTDEVVGVLRGLVSSEDGKERVFCERWW